MIPVFVRARRRFQDHAALVKQIRLLEGDLFESELERGSLEDRLDDAADQLERDRKLIKSLRDELAHCRTMLTIAHQIIAGQDKDLSSLRCYRRGENIVKTESSQFPRPQMQDRV